MSNQTLLKVHEWMAVSAIIVIMLILTLYVAFKHSERGHLSSNSTHTQNRIEIIVKGAVAHSGMYSLPKELLLKDVLAVAEVSSEADLRRFNLKKTVQQGRVVNVPVQPMVEVHVVGAVSAPVTVRVPRGTRVEELIDRIVLDEDADVKVLKRKRKLKDGETIHVPKLKHDKKDKEGV